MLLNSMRCRLKSRAKMAAVRSFRPTVERLEDRCVPAVVNTLVYNQITSLIGPAMLGSPGAVLSASGSRAVYELTSHPGNTGTTQIQIWDINADGSGQRNLDVL